MWDLYGVELVQRLRFQSGDLWTPILYRVAFRRKEHVHRLPLFDLVSESLLHVLETRLFLRFSSVLVLKIVVIVSLWERSWSKLSALSCWLLRLYFHMDVGEALLIIKNSRLIHYYVLIWILLFRFLESWVILRLWMRLSVSIKPWLRWLRHKMSLSDKIYWLKLFDLRWLIVMDRAHGQELKVGPLALQEVSWLPILILSYNWHATLSLALLLLWSDWMECLVFRHIQIANFWKFFVDWRH